MSKRFFVLTDLEGVVGIDSWTQTKQDAEGFDADAEAAAMDELAREVNACIEGIREVHPDAEIDVLDGHGPGGLRAEDLRGGEYVRMDDTYVFEPFQTTEYDAMLYVGQHAMAGTAFAPLRHTLSSDAYEYYKLNGTFIGEFAGGAIAAGIQGIPTVFLSGDDKACLEAEMFVPEIETVAVKHGRGEEAAEHRERTTVLEEIREGATRAVERAGEIPPLDGFEPPYVLEIRRQEPIDEIPDGYDDPSIDAERVDDRTIRVESEAFTDVYP